MSGFIAILSPERDPVDPAVLDRMIEALRYRGPDGTGVWRNGSVALAHCQLALTKEAAAERQPHANEDGTVRVVLDGRLDNRDELAGELRAEGLGLRDESDAELLLRAYECWGEACAARLLGDFAFAIWDDASQTLVCARDVLGVRPLYVHARDGLIAVASEIAPLLRHPGVRRDPNEGFIAEILTGHIVNRTDTVWRDISRLKPAHLVIATRGQVCLRRYWQVDPRFEIRYRHDEEYAEHLADLIRQAVRPRLRSAGPVGVMLSGGLDSASIVGAIHEMNGVNANGPLPTFSIVSPDEPWDETPSIDAIAAMWPVSSQRFRPHEPDCAFFATEAARYEDLPPYPNGVMANSLLTAAAGSGVRVLLTGLWSDEWLTGSYLHYADLLRGGHLGQFWRHYTAQPNRHDVYRPPSMFRSAIWPCLPGPVRQGIKRLLGRHGVPSWVSQSLATAVGLPDRIRPSAADVSFAALAKTDSHRMATGGLSLHSTEATHRSVSQFGIETRHPFGDRRIMEFGFAIPEEQRWRGPHTKLVLRNASRTWVPSLIRDRVTYGSASPVLLHAVQRHVESGLWHNSVIARRNWIDLVPLRHAYNEMLNRYRASDDGFERLVFPLWQVCAVEIWARNALKGEASHG